METDKILLSSSEPRSYGSSTITDSSGEPDRDSVMPRLISKEASDSSRLAAFVNSSMRFSGILSSSRHFGRSSSMSNEIFNLVQNIVGCGVLSLPSGIAAFSQSKSSSVIASATGLIFFTGAIFGYYFLLLGRICRATCTATYREAWEETVERHTNFIVLCNLIKPGMANLSYSIIMADTLKRLLASADHDVSRLSSLLLATLLVLLPLCLLKNIKMLTPFSIMGLLCMVITAVSMGLRFFDGSYDLSRDGRFVSVSRNTRSIWQWQEWQVDFPNTPHLPKQDLSESLQPKFVEDSSNAIELPNMLILACMLFEAFVAHYNAPRFYTELKDNTVERFATVSATSFFISSSLYAIIAAFGYLTFGENSNGLILNNYSTNDNVATICRASIFISVAFSYPIVFIGFRDGVLDLLNVPISKHTTGNLNALSIVLLAIITLLASFVRNLGVVNAVGGGTLGTVIVFVFPTLMFASCVNNNIGSEATSRQRLEVKVSFGLMMLGIVMGCVGVVHSLITLL